MESRLCRKNGTIIKREKVKKGYYMTAYGEDISVIEEQTEGIVNINKATESELMTLPGIGSSRAADIVRYRTDNGRFQTIEDIMKVSGIKEAAFNKIKNYICV